VAGGLALCGCVAFLVLRLRKKRDKARKDGEQEEKRAVEIDGEKVTPKELPTGAEAHELPEEHGTSEADAHKNREETHELP